MFFENTSWQTQKSFSIAFDDGIASPFALRQWGDNRHPWMQAFAAFLCQASKQISEYFLNPRLPIKVKTRKCPHPASHRLTLKLTVCFWSRNEKTAVRCYGSLFDCSPAFVVVYFEEVWRPCTQTNWLRCQTNAKQQSSTFTAQNLDSMVVW